MFFVSPGKWGDLLDASVWRADALGKLQRWRDQNPGKDLDHFMQRLNNFLTASDGCDLRKYSTMGKLAGSAGVVAIRNGKQVAVYVRMKA